MKEDEAKQIIEDILKKAGFELDSVTIEEKSEKEYYINIMTKSDAVSLIGQRGIVLTALQYIIKNIFRNQGITSDGDHIKVDVDSYRSTQESNVLKMAEKRANEVNDKGGKALLPPMSPFFRRLVHLFVKDNFPELSTVSQGGGDDRYVCIVSQNQSTEVDTEVADIYDGIEF